MLWLHESSTTSSSVGLGHPWISRGTLEGRGSDSARRCRHGRRNRRTAKSFPPASTLAALGYAMLLP